VDRQAGAADTGRVDWKPVTYAGFQKTLAGLKGKVVLVDFWAEFCSPCKKGFPHLVEMHCKYAKDGLAVVSVDLDDPTNPDSLERALDFLKDRNAVFTNLYVDPDEGQKFFDKLTFAGVPHISIYDRQGNLVKEFEGAGHNDEIDKLVTELLKR
jgi:thiol-disulfide isomerase/thioredoxin